MSIRLPKESKDQIKENLKAFFWEERSEEMGDLAAENFLDFIANEIGPHFYNQGVKDAKQMVEQSLMNVGEDLHSLERPVSRYK